MNSVAYFSPVSIGCFFTPSPQDAACSDPRHVHHTFQIVGKGDDMSMSSPSAAACAAATSNSAHAGGPDYGGGTCDMDVDDST